MLLIEQIFLIGINEKSNKISFDYKDYLFYGAIIMDLILQIKRINNKSSKKSGFI